MGGQCGSVTPCQGVCESGSSCRKNRCERPQLGNGCVGCTPTSGPDFNPLMQCVSGTVCDFNATRVNVADNVCRPGSLPPGGSCMINSQCLSNTCNAGVCQGAAVNTTCSSYNQCGSGLVCKYDTTVSTRRCIAAPSGAVGEFCTGDIDCQSGVCDTETNACVAAFALPAGSNCTQNYMCESKTCSSNGVRQVCVAEVMTRGTNEACPEGDINCLPGYKCVGAAFNAEQRAARVCRPTSGLFCNADSDCGNGDCLCYDAGRKCVATPMPNTECAADDAAVRAFGLFGIGSLSLNMPFLSFPAVGSGYESADLVPVAAKALCCTINQGGTGAAAVLTFQSSDLFLDCSQDPPTFSTRPESSLVPKRCTSIEPYTLSEVGAALTGTATVDPAPAPKSPVVSAVATLSPSSSFIVTLGFGVLLLAALL